MAGAAAYASPVFRRGGSASATERSSARRHDLELDGVALEVDFDGATLGKLGRQQRLSQRVLQLLHERALERARAERRLVAEIDEPHLGRLRDLERELTRRQDARQ